MAKRSLLNIIGKLYVDEKFRDKYFSDSNEALKRVVGLTTKEKNFLREHQNDIRRCIDKLNIKYDGEDKRS
jgi:hypothetical protein